METLRTHWSICLSHDLAKNNRIIRYLLTFCGFSYFHYLTLSEIFGVNTFGV